MAITAPTDITGCQLWLDSNDIDTLKQDSAGTTAVSADGDPVGYWGDKSGNSRHLTQGTTSAKPTYKTAIQNGKPILRFDGGDILSIASPSGMITNAVTIFVVYQLTDTNAEQRVFTTNRSGEYFFIFRSYTDTDLIGGYSTDTAGREAQVSYSDWSSWLYASIEATENSTVGIRVNGGTPTTAAIGTFDGVSTGHNIVVGSNRLSNNNFITGDVAEVILYNTQLGTTDRQDVETYLYNKWFVTPSGVTLPALLGGGMYGGMQHISGGL